MPKIKYEFHVKPVVLVDVDGVLADFIGAYLKVVNDVLGTSWGPSDIVEHDIDKCLGLTKTDRDYLNVRISELRMARNLAVYPGAAEGLRGLAKTSEVFFCTSILRACPTWTYDRAEWLEEHIGPGWGRRVVYTKLKYLVVGHALVDDMPYNIERWMGVHHGKGILWKRPYNQRACPDGATMTNSWEEVARLAREEARWQSERSRREELL